MLFSYAQQQSDHQLEASLDLALYNESDLITIEVPLSLPYQTDWKDFERVNGEINLNGKIYKYVKRKVAGGQLVLLCLPNYNKERLEAAKGDFFKCAGDAVQHNGSGKPGKQKPGPDTCDVEFQLHTPGVVAASTRVSCYGPIGFLALAALPGSTPEQPPETV